VNDRRASTALISIATLTLSFAALAAPIARAAVAPPPTRLSLADAVAFAAGRAPAVVEAGYRTREAEARRNQARAALLPSISGAASQSNRTYNSRTFGFSFPTVPGVPGFPELVGPFDVSDARLYASQTLFDPAGYERWRAAGVGVEASRAAGVSSADQASMVAAVAYLSLLRADAQVAASREDSVLAAELDDLAKSRLASGVSPAIDATRARTELSRARSLVTMAGTNRSRAEIDLARALGVEPGHRFELADSLSEVLGSSAAPHDSAAALVLAAERRPDLAAADAEVRRIRAERTAIQAERLPKLDLTANWGASGQHFDQAIATREVGIAVTLPIVDGLRREGRVTEQTAQLGTAEVRARDLRDQAAAEIESAMLDFENGMQQVDFAHERLGLAAEELAQARERFTTGVAGNNEVIDAQSSLVRAQEADIEARYSVALARVALARAVGVMQTVK